jgi:hypothetical protein
MNQVPKPAAAESITGPGMNFATIILSKDTRPLASSRNYISFQQVPSPAIPGVSIPPCIKDTRFRRPFVISQMCCRRDMTWGAFYSPFQPTPALPESTEATKGPACDRGHKLWCTSEP